MTLGMVTYYALGALLLWASLHVVGSTLGASRRARPLRVRTGADDAADHARAAPASPRSPTTALAIAFNGPHDKAVVAAGVLLYRAFTFGLEIPVGGRVAAGWLLRPAIDARDLAPSAPAVALEEAA